MTTERLTDAEFVAMCEHVEAATDLPWGRHRDEILRLDRRPDAKHEFLCERVLSMQPWDDDHDPIGESQEEVDVALMLAAVNALPALLGEIEMGRLSLVRAVNEAVKAEREACAVIAAASIFSSALSVDTQTAIHIAIAIRARGES